MSCGVRGAEQAQSHIPRSKRLYKMATMELGQDSEQVICWSEEGGDG
jgi:hypothetical protein